MVGDRNLALAGREMRQEEGEGEGRGGTVRPCKFSSPPAGYLGYPKSVGVYPSWSMVVYGY